MFHRRTIKPHRRETASIGVQPARFNSIPISSENQQLDDKAQRPATKQIFQEFCHILAFQQDLQTGKFVLQLSENVFQSFCCTKTECIGIRRIITIRPH